MAQLYIYEPQRHAFCLYMPQEDALMPGMRRLPLRVSDFLYLANTDIAWTHRAALDALDALCESFGEPFSVDVAFRTTGRCAHMADAQHFAGLAFEIGRRLPPDRRAELYYAAMQSGLFLHVSPPYLSGLSIRVAMARDLPELFAGDVGVYVFVLQSALLGAGLFSGALTGRYCAQTERGVRRLQAKTALPVTGRMRNVDWHALLRLTNAVPNAKIEP